VVNKWKVWKTCRSKWKTRKRSEEVRKAMDREQKRQEDLKK